MARSLLLLAGAVAFSILGRSGIVRAADCFVDSVAGNDANDGKSELTAVSSPSKIPAGCSALKFKPMLYGTCIGFGKFPLKNNIV